MNKNIKLKLLKNNRLLKTKMNSKIKVYNEVKI